MICKCGCGKEIIFKWWHKYYRHDFLKGHRKTKKKSFGNCKNCNSEISYFTPPSHKTIKNHFCNKKCCLEFKSIKNISNCKTCKKLIKYGRHKIKKFCSWACYKETFRNTPYVIKGGYLEIQIRNKGSRKKIRLHRIIIETIIRRKLMESEVVHHVNGDTSDNHIKNLMVFSSNSYHLKYHHNPADVPQSQIIFDGSKVNLDI